MKPGASGMSFSRAGRKRRHCTWRVLQEVLTSPEFRQDKLDLAITQTRSGIARRNDDANGIPDRELARILYGPTTPYGWQVEYEDLNHIHRQDLVEFYHRYYFPKNIMLAVYGDFKIDEMKAKLEATFADWKVEQPPVPKFPEVTAKPAPGIYFAEKSDVTQTFFAIGELGWLHPARQGICSVAGGRQYFGAGLHQPPDVAGSYQAWLCIRHQRAVVRKLRSSRDVPNRRQHEIAIDHGNAAGNQC